MIDLSGLNPPQREAVINTEGPLLILAGAGSGKTRALTHRVAHLISEGTPPWAILAITFTNKAAREMRERVIDLSGDAALDAWVMTFHACCARILRRDIEKLGYKGNFSIYDDEDQMAVIKSIIKDMDINDKQYPPREVKSIISDAKNRLLTPAEWLEEAGEDFRNAKVHEIFVKYEYRLKNNNALDFDDIILKTILLLADHPPVLQYYTHRFLYVMVDEY
jgi:DNA helicase-2/ATP-dependent DNA helicase PcrA